MNPNTERTNAGLATGPERQENAALAALAPAAFTLLELVVIVAVLGLGLLVLAPALAQTKPGSQALQCLNNNRMLNLAWRMYAQDNRDILPYASDNGNGTLNLQNAYAWTASHMDFDPANRANWDATVDIVFRPLWPYLKNTNVYRCPADASYVTVLNIRRPRARTFSMNMFVGGFAPQAGVVGYDDGWAWADPFAIYSKATDLSSANSPGPAKTFVFLDQREDSISWGGFMVDMTGYFNQPALYQLEDLPGIYHDGASTFSFADGHGEFRRWLDPRTTPPMHYNQAWYAGVTTTAPGDLDVAWLQDHATRPR